jgi:hypothetical protein
MHDAPAWNERRDCWFRGFTGRRVEAADVSRSQGLKTKREAVELGLQTLIRLRKQERIRRFRDKLPWSGDLAAMRTDR